VSSVRPNHQRWSDYTGDAQANQLDDGIGDTLVSAGVEAGVARMCGRVPGAASYMVSIMEFKNGKVAHACPDCFQ
jgi:hypothetical protein